MNTTAHQGILYIAGIGPGGEREMTPRCRAAIEDSELIVGYTTYIELIRGVIGPREVYTSGMRREKDRAAHALEQALAGRRVTLVSGGDPGVYGLAGLVLELASTEELASLHIEIVPGITAATAAAAALGAPLVHDFAVVINIGITAIAAYIGAGGLGTFISRGISQSDPRQLITGAIAVSILAVIADYGLLWVQKRLTPRGLR